MCLDLAFSLDYFPYVSLIKLEDTFDPLFKAIRYSMSAVKKLSHVI